MRSLAGLTFGSALVSPGGVLRVNNASYSAVLVRLHAALHSVSCNDVQRRKLLHPQYSPPSFAQMGGTRQPRRVTQRSLVCRVTKAGTTSENPSAQLPRIPFPRSWVNRATIKRRKGSTACPVSPGGHPVGPRRLGSSVPLMKRGLYVPKSSPSSALTPATLPAD